MARDVRRRLYRMRLLSLRRRDGGAIVATATWFVEGTLVHIELIGVMLLVGSAGRQRRHTPQPR